MNQYTIEYSIQTEDGQVIESNIGKEPLTVKAGESQVLPAIEQAIKDMGAGEEKTVTLEAKDAFGPANPDLIVEVHLSNITEEARNVGIVLEFENDEGEKYQGVVESVGDETAKVNFNHPLAGKNMLILIKVIDVK